MKVTCKVKQHNTNCDNYILLCDNFHQLILFFPPRNWHPICLELSLNWPQNFGSTNIMLSCWGVLIQAWRWNFQFQFFRWESDKPIDGWNGTWSSFIVWIEMDLSSMRWKAIFWDEGQRQTQGCLSRWCHNLISVNIFRKILLWKVEPFKNFAFHKVFVLKCWRHNSWQKIKVHSISVRCSGHINFSSSHTHSNLLK